MAFQSGRAGVPVELVIVPEAGGYFIELTLSDEARTYFYTEYHPLTFGTEIFGRLGYHLFDYSQPCIFG